MTAYSKQDQIDDLFTRAVELPSVERQAFLNSACNGDSELRAEVERLLAAHNSAERSTQFLKPLELKAVGRGCAVTSSGHLEIRCPSCHTPIEVAVDTALTDLTCSSCGSHFSLVDQSKATRMAPSLSKLGHFELIERIGVGGFGSVWKARDKELDRTVAIKIPRAGGMTGEEQEKFFREARAAAQLKHPNIVSVHEVGRDGDSVYIVSDFIRGVTLGDWLTGQQLTSREAASLCAKIAGALHHAHEQGVVHRDLKPADIMIDGEGQPHLMDFGLARRDVGEVTVTIDGHVLGTPAYMSPEQAQGEGHTADRRSDVYSLGVILFQLLTGELPFRGNARMLIHQVINDEPPSPRKLNSNVAKDLDTIALKCLDKVPARRYQSSRDLAEELRRYINGQPICARPVGPVERIWRWYQRNTTAITMTAGGYAALTAIILMCWHLFGIAFFMLGTIVVSPRIVAELVLFLTVFYPLMLAAGLATLKGNMIGLMGGTLIALIATVANLLAMLKFRLGLLQLEVISATQRDPSLHFQLCTLLFLLSLIGAVLYLVAMTTRIRVMLQTERKQPRPERRND